MIDICPIKLKDMKKSMEINMIRINAAADDVLIQGKVSRGMLSYEGSLIIGLSELNRLINLLQKMNPNNEISALFESEELPFGTAYKLDAQCLNYNTVSITELNSFTTNRRICA